jgi:hypothetical protein
LALSRALGDFIFKRNTDKRAEEQVVTGKTKKFIQNKKNEILYINHF